MAKRFRQVPCSHFSGKVFLILPFCLFPSQDHPGFGELPRSNSPLPVCFFCGSSCIIYAITITDSNIRHMGEENMGKVETVLHQKGTWSQSWLAGEGRTNLASETIIRPCRCWLDRVHVQPWGRDYATTRRLSNTYVRTSIVQSRDFQDWLKNIGSLIFDLAKTTKTKAREVAVMLEHLWNFFLSF